MRETGTIRAFRRTVRSHYRAHGRTLPWRQTEDPYEILVSEVMLQQTQVPRVIEKYEEFLRAFPDVRSLARARLREVLAAWQGLGYNRRAAALKRAAEEVLGRFDGKIPPDVDSLASLPGIGRATASAICAFAFNRPTVFVETNVRTVFIHHFFDGGNKIRDAQILPLVARTLDRRNPRQWYWALMDYGTSLKRSVGSLSTRSAHYRRQGRFEGSDRQVRGAILRALVEKDRVSVRDIAAGTGFGAEAVKRNLGKLCEEGVIRKEGGYYFIP
jgi:A/G-specific adenine glycosylase